mmetsp:Transcript_4444/g.8810  ORF Transcript_4444/g.8810 Transcript_4444/m.8810 type:complete len:89 (+) Transcript_4444:392-658(+)
MFVCPSLMERGGRESQDSGYWYRSPRKGSVGMVEVDESVFRSMSDTENPQGILAIFPRPELVEPSHPTLVSVFLGSLRIILHWNSDQF